jgi:hypothetical protein
LAIASISPIAFHLVVFQIFLAAKKQKGVKQIGKK